MVIKKGECLSSNSRTGNFFTRANRVAIAAIVAAASVATTVGFLHRRAQKQSSSGSVNESVAQFLRSYISPLYSLDQRSSPYLHAVRQWSSCDRNLPRYAPSPFYMETAGENDGKRLSERVREIFGKIIQKFKEFIETIKRKASDFALKTKYKAMLFLVRFPQRRSQSCTVHP